MISFVYFDLGGVIEIDFSGSNGWEELQQELGIKPEQTTEFGNIFKEYERKICTNMDIEDMKDILNQKLGLQIPLDYSLMQSFVTRFKNNPSIWPVLQQLQEHNIKIGIFTNMYVGMFDAIQNIGILPHIEWDVIVDSTKIDYIKPDKEAFEIATQKAGVQKEEILFVENSKHIIDAAKEFGWQTLLYNPKNPEKSSEELSQLIKTLML